MQFALIFAKKNYFLGEQCLMFSLNASLTVSITVSVIVFFISSIISWRNFYLFRNLSLCETTFFSVFLQIFNKYRT